MLLEVEYIMSTFILPVFLWLNETSMVGINKFAKAHKPFVKSQSQAIYNSIVANLVNHNHVGIWYQYFHVVVWWAHVTHKCHYLLLFLKLSLFSTHTHNAKHQSKAIVNMHAYVNFVKKLRSLCTAACEYCKMF